MATDVRPAQTSRHSILVSHEYLFSLDRSLASYRAALPLCASVQSIDLQMTFSGFIAGTCEQLQGGVVRDWLSCLDGSGLGWFTLTPLISSEVFEEHAGRTGLLCCLMATMAKYWHPKKCQLAYEVTMG